MNHPHGAGGMPEPIHHPSAETLALYAAGNMRPGFDVVVAAHLQAWIARRGLKSLGPSIYARYNAPFVPWPLRRNEVLILLR